MLRNPVVSSLHVSSYITFQEAYFGIRETKIITPYLYNAAEYGFLHLAQQYLPLTGNKPTKEVFIASI